MAWLIIALGVTWLLILVAVPSALGHAFRLGREEGMHAAGVTVPQDEEPQP